MRTFEEDFAAALKGDPGYRGCQPQTAAALYRLGLITEEHAWDLARQYQDDWRQGWDDSEWWLKTAEIAWHNETPWWKKFLWAGVPSVSWQSGWIRERRGW